MAGVYTSQKTPTSGKLPANTIDARDLQGIRDGSTRCGIEESLE